MQSDGADGKQRLAAPALPAEQAHQTLVLDPPRPDAIRRPIASSLFPMRLRQLLSITILAIAVFAAGCTGSGRLRYDSPQEAFDRGKEYFDRGKFDRAIDYFQAVFDYGRTTEQAADAQLYLARSYFENGEYILAANEYTRFLSVYRNDPSAESAEYERAMSYYRQSPGYQLDQTPTEQAITYFQLFLDRFPQSELKEDAEERIRELREKLARKEFAGAELYERRELYEAAALSYVRVFDKYPDTRWADNALLGAIRTYILFSEQSIRGRQQERLRTAVDNYERLVQLFPDSPLLKEAEQYYEQAANRLSELASTS